jgi:hypothetical protein
MSIPEIIDQTGLGKKSVELGLNSLRTQYRTGDIADLAALFIPKLKQPLEFTSHDCVIVDAALSPTTAANLLHQVLGEDYAQDLKNAL